MTCVDAYSDIGCEKQAVDWDMEMKEGKRVSFRPSKRGALHSSYLFRTASECVEEDFFSCPEW